MSDEVKLLPCPFCESSSLQVWNCRTPTRGPAFYAVCRNIICAASGPSRDTEAEAIAAWNTRAIEATRPTDMEVQASALAGADDWEVGPCVNHLGNVTSWDICLPRAALARGVAVVASVYSGETVARAILAAIQTAAVASRRAALTRMVQLDEELGLYDDEPVAASGTLTEGGDVEQAPGDSLNGPTLEDGDAHE